MSKVKEMQADLAELKTFLEKSQRPKVKDFLSLETRRLETALMTLESEEPKTEAKPSASKVAAPACDVNMRDYAWDQSEKFIKLYVSLKNIQSLAKEAVSCKYSDRSVTMKASGLDNKNYVLTINNLLHSIKPDSSHFKIKTDMVVVFLAKAETQNWECVTGGDKQAKDKNKKPELGAANQDPNASMMTLMKQMYDDGDSEMKQMLNKAMYESQQKQMSGNPLDMAGDMAGAGL